MGIETLLIGSAVAGVASSAAQAVSGMSSANQAAKLQNQQLAEQAKQIGTQQQLNKMQGVLAEFDFLRTGEALDDASRGNALARTELSLATRELGARRAALESATRRLGTETDIVLENAKLEAAGFALRRRDTAAQTVDKQADEGAKALASLGTLSAVAAETGLAGTTITAFARQIGAQEGTAIGEARGAAGRALEGIAIDEAQGQLRTASALGDLQGKADSLSLDAVQQAGAEGKAAVQAIRLDLQDRAIARDRSAAAVQLEAKRAGVQAGASDLESKGRLAEIAAADSNLRASMATTNAIFGVFNSGLQIAGAYAGSQMKLDALRAGQKRVQDAAR